MGETDEVEELKKLMMEPSMIERGTRAMGKSGKRREQAKVLYERLTIQYRNLAALEDKKMVKAWAKANKVRENHMDPERLQVILEEDGQLQEDTTPEVPEGETIPEQPPEPDLKGEKDGDGAPKMQATGKARKLTEYFNKIGGQSPQRAPKGPLSGAGTQKSTKTKTVTGGVTKTPTRKRNKKLEEPTRAKMELALRNFLEKKPPDRDKATK